MAIRNYKLEIKGSKESVTFGPRSFGDAGRDILIIKNALGGIEKYKILVGTDVPSVNNYDPNGWFDCLEGKKVSDAQAATFDNTLRDYIIKFQLDNQFYILCYYFTKYAIPQSLATQNAIAVDGLYSSPLDEVLTESEIADWVASGQNKIFLSGGKSIQISPGTDDPSDYAKNALLSRQIELISKMFDSEFGKIGEATLAILHGWLPRTSLYSQGYKFDPRVFGKFGSVKDGEFPERWAYDLVLNALYDSFASNNLSQKLNNSKSPNGPLDSQTDLESGVDNLDLLYDKYKEQVAVAERIKFSDDEASNSNEVDSAGAFELLPGHFKGLRYSTSARSPDYKSILFQSLEDISVEFPAPDILAAKKEEDYKESLERILEPDPFMDPDPFIINEQKIGYFLKTTYTLDNLPPFPDPNPDSDNRAYEEAIRELEDLALSYVMSFYGKPEIFYLDTRDVNYQTTFIGDMRQYFLEGIEGEDLGGPKPNHNGDKLSGVYKGLEKQVWVLSTKTNHEALGLGEDVEIYSSYERDGQGNLYQDGIIEPLIKFVEFRTPSLRPGDTYRAKFFINREKLDYIKDGFKNKLTVEQEKALEDLPVSRSARIQDLCEKSGKLGASNEDNQRRYEEYRSIASKNKKEIARILRESTLESYNNQDLNIASNIDLGVFGTIDISNPISAFGDLVGGFTANVPVEDPEHPTSGEISISYPDLVDRCTSVSRDLNNAYDVSLQDKITFLSPKNFNGAEKAFLLTNLPVEVRQCITKYGDSNFNFGDTPRGIGDGNYLDVNPLSNFTGIGQDEITFKFKSHPTKPGLIVEGIKAGSVNIFEVGGKKIFNEFPSLVDPIVVNYLARIEEMSGGPGGIVSLFSPPPASCRDIGIGRKGLGYLSRYTPGLKGDAEDFDVPIKQWWNSEVSDPFFEWYDNSFNFKNLVDPQFNTDAFLAILGKQCSLTKLYSDFKDKISFSGFICNFLKCLNLPAINLSIPNLNLPPIPPKFNIFGWYTGLVRTLLKKFFEILVRILCSLIQFILDFLSSPFCEDNLRDELYGEFAGQTPLIQQALVDGLLDLGISKENMLPAKDFVAAVMAFLTGSEICALLNGEQIDPTAMAMIQDLAIKKGLEELSSPAAIRNFFQTLSIMLPDFCSDLEAANWVISITDCDDTTSAAEQYRRKMMAGEATQEDMDKALNLLDKNLQDQLERLQALGEQGIRGLLPDVVNFGDPNALLNKLPDSLEQQANETMKQLFEPTKMGYLSSLSSFGPGLFLDSPRMPVPGDPEFDLEAFLTVTTILHNLKIYADLVENQPDNPSLQYYTVQLNVLHMIYEIDPGVGLAAYRWTRPNNEAFDIRRGHYTHFYKEEQAKNFKKLTTAEIAREDQSLFVYKPIGFAEDFYFRIDEETGSPINGEIFENEDGVNRLKYDDVGNKPYSSLLPRHNSNLQDFSFQLNYVVEYRAEFEPPKGLTQESTEQNVDLTEPAAGAAKQVVITAIKNRIDKMQRDLFLTLNRVATPKVGSEYLGGIKDLFSQAQETLNENIGDENKELINIVSSNPEGLASSSGINQNVNSLILNLNEGSLRANVKYNEFGNTKSVSFDPYSIEISGDNMFNRDSEDPIVIEVCDTIPGPDKEQQNTSETESIYKKAIADLELELSQDTKVIYTRRELFARKIMSSLFDISGKYKNLSPDFGGEEESQKTRDILNPTTRTGKSFKNILTNNLYGSAMEGIFEQIFFALQSSRIYDEDEYYPGLAQRVAGLMTIEENEENQDCVRNRYNVSQLGLLSFEKIVTDELAKQLANEMSKPENAPQNLDYDSEGPFEKAIKNVCFLGFVRICLVEVLLKGSLAYSVWDFEGVFDEKIFEEFLYEYVKSELNSKQTMKQNWEAMASRITGIENSSVALKRLVRNQSMKMLDISKKIFKNDPSDVVDYHNWYSKYYIPQAHCSRDIAIKEDQTAEAFALQDLDINTGQVIGAGEFRREASDVLYWAHPLLDEENIIAEDIERRTEEAPTIRRFSQLVGSNDPFFHIEHLVRVKGPLASIEGITIPGSAITDSIMNVDVRRAGSTSDQSEEAKAVRKIITEVSTEGLRDRRYLNINDARARTNLPQLDMGIYGFQANPTQPEGSAGAAVEKARDLLASGEVDPSTYAESTEIFNIKDFKATLNFKVTDGNMQKFLSHVRGQMYYPGPAGSDGTSPIEDTTSKELNGFPAEVKKLPTRFIKRTRRVIKFTRDFVTGMFDDFGVTGTEDYKRKLYGDSPLKFLSSNPGRRSNDAKVKFDKFKRYVKQSVEEQVDYFIQPDNPEVLYKVFEDIRNKKEDNPEILIELTDDNFSKEVSNPSNSFDKIHNTIPDSASDYLDEAISYKLAGETVKTSIVKSSAPGRNSQRRGLEHKGLTKIDSSYSTTNTAGVTYDDSDRADKSLFYEFATAGQQLTTIINEGDDPTVIFENRIGKFRSEEDYINAKKLAASNNDDLTTYKGSIWREMTAREEHWVETVYEFSGDSAILAGIYGSFTIGETMDPAVLDFYPEDATRDAWVRTIGTIRQAYGDNSITLFKNSPAVSYGRTFWPKEGLDPGAPEDIESRREIFGRTNNISDEEIEEYRYGQMRSARNESVPFIARPMGIDKLTNRRLTSKVLTRASSIGDINEDFLRAYTPYGRTISLDPVNNPVSFYRSLGNGLGRFTKTPDLQIVHELTRPVSMSPRSDDPERYRDVCKLIHKKPVIRELENGRYAVRHSRFTLLPPNIYRIPLRVLVTQVYIAGNVEKVYSRVVPPKYITNLKNRSKDENGNYNEGVEENKAYLNRAIRKICNEFVEFMGDLPDAPLDGFPDFSTDFSVDFGSKLGEGTRPEQRTVSALQLNSRDMYCSVERIYSEAFHLESDHVLFNSQNKLDQLFKENRGMLMNRSVPRIKADTLRGAFRTSSERVCYLESLNYFYDLPSSSNIATDRNASEVANFHKTIFSLNNIMQWFLRYRRHDSLWGLLTPQNSADVTTSEVGYGGKQKFPLSRVGGKYLTGDNHGIQNKKGNKEYLRSPWQMGFFTNRDFPSFFQKTAFFKTGYKLGPSKMSKHNSSVVYPESAICLNHAWSDPVNFELIEKPKFNSRWGNIIFDEQNAILTRKKDNQKPGVLDIEPTEAAKYLIQADTAAVNTSKNIVHTIPLLDGFGDYYVNYNRLNTIPMLQNGGSLFVADGRISMDDISTSIKMLISNIFEGFEQDSIGRDVINFIEANGYSNFFQDIEGNISPDNFNFIEKTLCSIDANLQLEDLPGPNLSGMSEESPFMTILSSMISNFGNINDILSRLNTAIGQIESLLAVMIKRCGAQINYQVFLENDGIDSVFGSSSESIIHLSIMHRFLIKIRDLEQDASLAVAIAQKVYLLTMMSGYNFGKVIANIFRPGGSVSDVKKEAEADWALCCLMWVTLWMSGNFKTFPVYGPSGSPYNSSVRTTIPVGRFDQFLQGGWNHSYFSWYRNDSGTYIKFNGVQGNNEGGHWGQAGDAPYRESLRRIFNLMTIVSYQLGLPRNFNQTQQLDYFVMQRTSQQGLLKHDGPGRHTQRASPFQFAPLTIGTLKKYLEGGERNYDFRLKRPLTNREIINAVYDIVAASVGQNGNYSAKKDHAWEYYLFGGDDSIPQAAAADPSVNNLVSVIKSGLNIMGPEAMDRNSSYFKPHPNQNKWSQYVVSTSGDRKHFDLFARKQNSLASKINHLFKDNSAGGGKSYIDASQLETIGLSLSSEGLEDLINTLVTDLGTFNSVKTEIYSNSTTSNTIVKYRHNMSKENLALLLGSEIYSEVFTGDTRGDLDSFKKAAIKAVRTSPIAARGYTHQKLKAIYNKKNQDNYKDMAKIMKKRHIDALDRYTALDRTVDSAIFDSAAIINSNVMSGLFESSKVDQVCRLVMNFPNLEGLEFPNNFLSKGMFKTMATEQRSILMSKVQQGSNFDLSNMTLSVPVAEYEEAISKFGETGENAKDNFLVSCYNLSTLVEDFENKTSWMAQELLAKDSSKLFMKYIFPTRRYQALATIFATTSMSGYTTMPSLMRAPKSSLSFLMGISSMTSKERIEMFKNMSQADLFKSLSDNKSSEPGAMKCFDLPFNEDFLDNFLDLLLEQIKEFPAVLFRGLANVIDPAYKEMKMHWDDCEMRNLTYAGWKPFTARDRSAIAGGAHGEDNNKKYASLLVTSAADIGWSISRLFVPGQATRGAKGLAHSVSHIANYVYKGPLSLLDGAFQFQFPCKDVDLNWPESSSFANGRYGHPFTPLTYIALAMPELRGDKRLRQMSGRCTDNFEQQGTLRDRLDRMPQCSDGDDPPFGAIPEPKDFEEE